MVLLESKKFRFGISDSPNINKVPLFPYLNYFCYSVFSQTWCLHLRFKKRIKNYVEITAENFIVVLSTSNTVTNFT